MFFTYFFRNLVTSSIIVLLAIIPNHLSAQLQFENISVLSNIDQAHTSVMYMGGGVAFFDYNNDGFDDIFLTGGTQSDRLYKNLGNLQFEDVTEHVRLFRTNREHSMGVTVGDINNDGYKDLFVTYGVGETNRLFLNIEGKRFEDITISSGLENFDWSMGATFGDINLDGFIDLYVINWVKEFEAIEDSGGSTIGFNHKGYANNLYLNNGDNSFREVSKQYEVDNLGCGLAVLFTDYNNDSYPDLYIANDFGEWGVPNTLLKNDYPTEKFSDQSVSTGLNAEIYGMGIAAGDYDRDGDIDYYTTNIGKNVLFKNTGFGSFVDVTALAGVSNELSNGANTTGWGTVFADVNNDGYEDLLVSNGYVPAAPFIGTASLDPNKLFINQKDGTFKDVTEESGLGDPNISRGVASSDLDNDGDLDFLFTYLSTDIGGKLPHENILLYENKSENENNWIKFKLEGVSNSRDAYNTKVKLFIAEEMQIRELYSTSSHGSQNSSILHFGLGEKSNIDSIKLIWPGGNTNTYRNLQSNQSYFIKEGEGQVSLLGCMDIDAENYDPNATISFGCKTSTVTGFKESFRKTVKIFPNPVNNQLSISLNDSFGRIKGSMEIYDSNGRKLSSKPIESFSKTVNYDVLKLVPGIYYLKISTARKSERVKFIKN